MSNQNRKTTGQRTGIEANPNVDDQRHGQLDSAGVGSQNPHQSPGKVVPTLTSSRRQLRSAMSSEGQVGTGLSQVLFSGPLSGRTSEQDSMESSDSKERRWLPAKSARAESSDVFARGNASVRFERSTNPYVTNEPPAWKPRQGKSQQT